ncbi:hypothetical protein SNE40_019148 [Patella caerulea]|uniref:IkappaB kinase n=1 Tax=Patella caerulea TaxID=87958 RepID=A0AAN8JA16_PATCE
MLQQHQQQMQGATAVQQPYPLSPQPQQYNNFPEEFLQVGQRRERWILDRTLGSGGFGTVTLWKNEVTGEEVAIKKCRLGGNMSHKNCQRWQIEVDIMKRLNHENVVSGCDVPVGLESLKDDLPLLAMEYCAGGDLRKVLNNPKNCCGMSEFEVRCLAQDISSAIEYLHNKRIIHRDLKPENIVLRSAENRTIYKLIDLGYAKELDQSSVCQSFVGTLQYLAPELFVGQKYTQTVDYWSFGTVIFECLTGSRPFLPSLSPVRWHKEVNQKSPDDICAYFDNNAEIRFSKKLFTPNHLTKIMQNYFENWLKLMLRWDAKSRGGGLSEERRPNCFVHLKSILSLKISHILFVEANRLISVPVPSTQTMQDLQRIIEQETKIPPLDQDILLASGLSPDLTKPASQCWSEPGEEEWLVFLFRKGDTNLTYKRGKQLPQMVQHIVKEPKTILTNAEQRKAWAHAVFFCQEQNLDFKRLIGSQRATMLSLLRSNSEFVRMKSKMLSDVGQMMARKDHFKESLELDIAKYEDQRGDGITSDLMFSKWQKTEDDIEKFNELRDYALKLEQDANALQTKIVELQKSPYARGKPSPHLNECEEKARTLFSQLRQAPRGNNLMEHTQMVDAVTKCILFRDRSVAEMLAHISKICSCRAHLNQILPHIQRCCDDISAACKQLSSNQRSRQQDIWKLIKVALGQAKALSRSNSQKYQQSMPQQVQPVNHTPMSITSPSLMQSLTRCESMRIMENGKEQAERNQRMMKQIIMEDQSNLISSSLDELLNNQGTDMDNDIHETNLT